MKGANLSREDGQKCLTIIEGEILCEIKLKCMVVPQGTLFGIEEKSLFVDSNTRTVLFLLIFID